MKKTLLLLFVLLNLMGFLPQQTHAQTKTAKAVPLNKKNVNDSGYLYFIYNKETYTVNQEVTFGDVFLVRVPGQYSIDLNKEYSQADRPDWVYTRADGQHDTYPAIKHIYFTQSFGELRPKSLSNWFNYHNLNSSNDYSTIVTVNCYGLNTSEVTSLCRLFRDCSKLETITNISGWNTQKVTDMDRTFYGCKKLKELNLSGWDVSKVTTMIGLFMNCQTLKELNSIQGWTPSSVTVMSYAFCGCNNIDSLQSINGWNPSGVEDMGYTFGGCKKLKSLDLSNWKPNKLKNLEGTFSGCSNLNSINLSGWNTPHLGEQFINTAYEDNQTHIEFGKTSSMFLNCSSLERLSFPDDFNTAQVTEMKHMFNGCSNLKSITFGTNFTMNAVSAANSVSMFANCPKLRYIDFYNCSYNVNGNEKPLNSVSRSSNTFNCVPLTTVIYLPKKNNKVTDVTNVVYSYNGDETDLRCPLYYSSDKMELIFTNNQPYSQEQTDIEIPRDFITNEAVYIRTMPAGAEIGTVMLPYDFASNDSIQAYTLIGENATHMRFESTNVVPANTPFVFKVKIAREDGTAHFWMKDETGNFGITIHKTIGYDEDGKSTIDTDYFSTAYDYNGWTARGYYVNQIVPKNVETFFLNRAGTKFCQATQDVTLYPHRATFHGTYEYPLNGNSDAKSFDLETVDLPTAIAEADTREEINKAQAIFDMQGRRIATLQKGINIIRMKDGTTKKLVLK